MAMKFSHAVGYRGIAKVRGTTLLCTGGNINLTQEPIQSGGVWGAGYANAAPIAYAFNYLSLEGSMSYEYTNNTSAWDDLKNFAFEDRTTASKLLLLPDGTNGFEGNGWCSSISFEASEGSAVTGSMNFKGDPDPEDTTEGIKSISDEEVTNLGLGDDDLKKGHWNGKTVNDFAGATLIPYWNTEVRCANDPIKDVTSWSCSYNSDLQVLKCCNCQSTPPLGADYILCGEMGAEGSITVFALRESGACSFSKKGFHEQKKNLKFVLGFGSSTKKQVRIPYALINSASTSMATGASYITCEYSFTAFGDGINSVMNMEDFS